MAKPLSLPSQHTSHQFHTYILEDLNFDDAKLHFISLSYHQPIFQTRRGLSVLYKIPHVRRKKEEENPQEARRKEREDRMRKRVER